MLCGSGWRKGGRESRKEVSKWGDCHKSPSFYHQDSQRVRVHAHQLCVFLRRNLLPQKLLWLTGLRVMSFGDSLAWPGFSCMSLAEFTVGLLQWAWDPIGTFGPEVSLGLPVVTISPSFLFLFFFVIILVFCKSLFIYPAVLGPSWGTQNLVVSRGIFRRDAQTL